MGLLHLDAKVRETTWRGQIKAVKMIVFLSHPLVPDLISVYIQSLE